MVEKPNATSFRCIRAVIKLLSRQSHSRGGYKNEQLDNAAHCQINKLIIKKHF